jgi:hypothetical protein
MAAEISDSLQLILDVPPEGKRDAVDGNRIVVANPPGN